MALPTQEADWERRNAHWVFLQHSSPTASLNRDSLRQSETSFMDTVNKFLLLSKPKYKQECLMILRTHQEGAFAIPHTLLTCQLQHFTLDWEAIKSITRSLTRAFKSSFETTHRRNFALIGILAHSVAWMWHASSWEALSPGFLPVSSSDWWRYSPHSQGEAEWIFQISLILKAFMPEIIENCF